MELSLGQRITYYRQEAGMRQKDLAAQTGISATALNYYEKDKREPNVLTLIKLAKALKITGNTLLGIECPEAAACDANEYSLIRYYRKLNDRGKQKILEYAADLGGNPAYVNVVISG